MNTTLHTNRGSDTFLENVGQILKPKLSPADTSFFIPKELRVKVNIILWCRKIGEVFAGALFAWWWWCYASAGVRPRLGLVWIGATSLNPLSTNHQNHKTTKHTNNQT